MRKSKLKYLDPAVLSRLNNMKLIARLVVEGFIIGRHKSPYHGFSVEFAEHRPYMPGDEIKHIDWKLYGKTDRFYVKQFEEETNLKSYILLDKSGSMGFKSQKVSKLEYGSYLAASLGYLMLNQQDAAGLVLFDRKISRYIPPLAKMGHLNLILHELEKVTPGDETSISLILHEMAEKIKKRGLVILISDLMDNVEDIIFGLKHFRYKKHEVIVFHILDPQEVEFKYKNFTKFIDLESGESISTQPWFIRNSYARKLQEIINYSRSQFRNNQIDYVLLTTDHTLDHALIEYLNKRRRLG